jgi:hypothetical protein
MPKVKATPLPKTRTAEAHRCALRIGTMPELNAQVEALAIAYVELAKFLGREQVIPVMQLATALKDAARAAKHADTKAALEELSKHLSR